MGAHLTLGNDMKRRRPAVRHAHGRDGHSCGRDHIQFHTRGVHSDRGSGSGGTEVRAVRGSDGNNTGEEDKGDIPTACIGVANTGERQISEYENWYVNPLKREKQGRQAGTHPACEGRCQSSRTLSSGSRSRPIRR